MDTPTSWSPLGPVAHCAGGEGWCHATGETVLGTGDAVVVAGAVRAVERFAALTRR